MAGRENKSVKKKSSQQAPDYNSNQFQNPPQPYPQYPPPPIYPPPAPGYPPHAPGYSPYPQYPHYPQYPPPQSRSSTLPIVIVIIVILIIIITTVVIAGVLYVWVSGFDGEEYVSNVRISAISTEKSSAYVITIASMSGGYLWLYDANFEISDDNDILQYRLRLDDSNPTLVYSGESVIYPMTRSLNPVTDGSGGALDGADSPHEYTNCTIAYIDQDGDEEVSVDDSIWIYKDNNNDGTDDVRSRYSFMIIDDYDEMVLRKTL